MEALARQGALQELGIADCMLLSDEAMQHIVHLLPGLQSLKFPTQCRGLHFPTSQVCMFCDAVSIACMCLVVFATVLVPIMQQSLDCH